MHVEEQLGKRKHKMKGTYDEGLIGKIYPRKKDNKRMHDDTHLRKTNRKRRGQNC